MTKLNENEFKLTDKAKAIFDDEAEYIQSSIQNSVLRFMDADLTTQEATSLVAHLGTLFMWNFCALAVEAQGKVPDESRFINVVVDAFNRRKDMKNGK